MGITQDLIKPATAWLAKQKSEVVILIAILAVLLAGLFRGFPWAMDEVKEHIREINTSHEKQVNTISETFDKASERDFRVIQGLMRQQGIDVESASSPSKFVKLSSPSEENHD